MNTNSLFKRLGVISLTLIFLTGNSFCYFSANNNEKIYKEVEEIYGIPSNIACTLQYDYLMSLYAATISNSIEIQDAYYVIRENDSGEVEAVPCTAQEFEDESILSPASFSDNTDKDKLIHIRITLIEKDSETTQISAAFTWKKVAQERMHDAVSISVKHGTVKMNTTNGFYTNTTSGGNTTTRDFIKANSTSSKNGIFKETGKAALAEFNLVKFNDPPKQDYVFLRMDATKESVSMESVTADYVHQRVRLSLDTSYSVNALGFIIPTTGSLVSDFDEVYHTASFSW